LPSVYALRASAYALRASADSNPFRSSRSERRRVGGFRISESAVACEASEGGRRVGKLKGELRETRGQSPSKNAFLLLTLTGPGGSESLEAAGTFPASVEYVRDFDVFRRPSVARTGERYAGRESLIRNYLKV